jgi:hypothetical protein
MVVIIYTKITVLEWVEGLYEEQIYTGENLVVSPLLGDLDLSVDRVLEW